MTPSNTVAGGSASPCEPLFVERPKHYSFELGPLGFARILHPKGGTGQACFGGPVPGRMPGKDGKVRPSWSDRRWSPYAIATRDLDISGARFLTMATYRYHQRGETKPAKTEANIVAIGSNWIDLDAYGTAEWKDTPPAVVREVLMNTCEDLGIPQPSLINSSGRGLLAVWLYPTQPWPLVEARWKAVQRVLHERFAFLGSDPSGRTPTKWFRLPGTWNEKSGLPVKVAWPNSIAEIVRHDFDALAGAVLPLSRWQAKERKADRAAKVAKPRPPRPEQIGGKIGGRSYWQTLRTDLDRLFALRFGQGSVPDGRGRNAWIKALSYAAAWDMPAIELEGYVRSQAARCGLDEDDALAKTTSIRKRARESADGIRNVWKGHKVDPRYRPKPQTFVEDLAILPVEMRKANLRMLIDPKRRASNAVERAVKARRAAGVGSRDVSQDTRLAVGKAALDLREQGLTNAEVGLMFDVTPRYLDTALRDARAVAAIGKVRKPALPKARTAPALEPQAIVVPGEVETIGPAHEVLRGTRARPREVVIDLVTGGGPSYLVEVTTVGTYLSPDGRPLCASRPSGRLCFDSHSPALDPDPS